MQKRKSIGKIAIALIVVIIVIIAGAGGYYYYLSTIPPKPTPTPTPSVTTLNVVVVGGWNQQNVETAANDYMALHPNVKINLIIATFSSYLEKEEVAESQANASSYDIFTWSPTSSGPIAPYVTPLNSFISADNYNLSNFASGMLASGGEYYNLTSKTTTVIGFPIDTSIYNLYYLKSIFDNATLASEFQSIYHVPFNPNEWTNWTEVIWADQFLTSNHVTQYGMLIDDNPTHGMIDAFPAIFYWWYRSNSTLNGGTSSGLPGYGILFNTAGQPDFANAAGAAALETYKALIQYGDPSPNIEIIDYSTLESVFETGHAAMDLGWTEYGTTFNSTTTSPAIGGNVGVALLPGGYSEAGGSIMGIAKYASNKTAAFQFLEFLTTNNEAIKAYYAGGFVPTELSALKILETNATISGFIQTEYQGTLVANANPPLLSISSTVLVPEFNYAINNYLTGVTTNPLSALQTAATEWSHAV
ncbi:MAG: extracellular solute-binding protein [Nitrososphaerota archaeon]|jgi:multiple sugar transport system substrate-binding protein|nr:extracellular solute-binding protein [Nitrososphaerota archaeon]MDG6932090.1 extracellular solute-binding protein [Nitrososphaerota archaeon]MDG6935632.1 extracellular solute-binding protein [Nitrososphaerota archaeon]MDG6943547.1 extracellular solute-binding protein [Nitrososphaerota archaeon]